MPLYTVQYSNIAHNLKYDNWVAFKIYNVFAQKTCALLCALYKSLCYCNCVFVYTLIQ